MSDKGIALEKMTPYGSREAVIQNMLDAGCSRDTIEHCISCLDCGEKAALLERLEKHRKDLLQKVHEGEKQIGCLDYLVYQIDCCNDDNKNDTEEIV